jgi:hypothetical protein
MSTETLSDLWAGAYDCWVNAPGREDVPLYTQPTSGRDEKGTNEWPSVVRGLKLPVFALTGWNPVQSTPNASSPSPSPPPPPQRHFISIVLFLINAT